MFAFLCIYTYKKLLKKKITYSVPNWLPVFICSLLNKGIQGDCSHSTVVRMNQIHTSSDFMSLRSSLREFPIGMPFCMCLQLGQKILVHLDWPCYQDHFEGGKQMFPQENQDAVSGVLAILTIKILSIFFTFFLLGRRACLMVPILQVENLKTWKFK